MENSCFNLQHVIFHLECYRATVISDQFCGVSVPEASVQECPSLGRTPGAVQVPHLGEGEGQPDPVPGLHTPLETAPRSGGAPAPAEPGPGLGVVLPLVREGGQLTARPRPGVEQLRGLGGAVAPRDQDGLCQLKYELRMTRR